MKRQTTEHYVRTYNDGDEEEIIQLFEKCYGNHAGFVLRISEYWRWCCLKRPDVERKGVFIVVNRFDGKIVGYVVVGKSGNIWEFAYDPQRNKKEIVQLLLQVATDYLTKVETSSVNLQVPVEDNVVREVCGKLGFAESKPTDVFVSVLDLQRLLLLLVSSRKEKLKNVDEKIAIKLKDAPTWMPNKFGIEIRNGKVGVLEENQKPTIYIEASLAVLSSLLFGKITPFLAWFYRKIKVKPFWKIQSFFKLFSFLVHFSTDCGSSIVSPNKRFRLHVAHKYTYQKTTNDASDLCQLEDSSIRFILIKYN